MTTQSSARRRGRRTVREREIGTAREREIGTVREWFRGTGLRLTVLVLAVLAGAGAAAAIPAITGRIVDRLAGGSPLASVAPLIVACGAAGVVTAALLGVRTALAHAVAEHVIAATRRSTYRAVSAKNPLAIETEPAGSSLAALTVDIEALRTAFRDAVPEIASAAALLLWALFVMVTLSPILTLVALIGVPLVVLAALRFRRVSGPVYAAQRQRMAITVGRLTEDLHGATTAVAFGRDDDRRSGLRNDHQAFLDTAMRAMRARNRFFPFLVAVEGLVVVAVIWIGGTLAIDGRIELGVVATFALGLGLIFGPLRQLSTWVDLLQAASAALSRILTVLEDDDRRVPTGPFVPLPAVGDLELDGVRFAYTADHPVLDGVSLRVAPGERVALTGVTGAGKSTIARLLVRWADPDEGAVRFGGIDIRSTDPDELARRVLFVPQEGLRFPGTVRDVVRLVVPAADDAAISAALSEIAGSRVQLDDDAEALSAADMQFITLAAVLLADPPAIVLDEATSALDPTVSAQVDRAVDRVLHERAVLVIAHRADTVARCDRQVHLRDGELETPSPEDLAVSAEQ